MANNDIVSILVGQDHILHFIHDPKYENCFGSIDTFKVDYLSKTDAIKLIDEPIQIIKKKRNGDIVKESRYSKEAIERIYELTAGNAYLIMNFCSKLVNYLNEIHSSKISRAHIDMFLAERFNECEERWFEPLINDLNIQNDDNVMKKNENIMKVIAQLSANSEEVDISDIEKHIGNKKSIDALISRGVLDVNKGKCKIRVGLYKEFLLNRYGEGDFDV